MSIDRLIAVRFPLAAPRLCTTKRAKVTVVIITLLITPLNVHMLYTFKYFEDAEAGKETLRDILLRRGPNVESDANVAQFRDRNDWKENREVEIFNSYVRLCYHAAVVRMHELQISCYDRQ
jgi:hypothetical protein